MNSHNRDKIILECLRKNEFVDVSYLSELLTVSEMTVRRDLDRLEKQELLVRVHGGARLIPQKMHEPPLKARIRQQANEKYQIGCYAASLIEEGDAVAFDDSSTTYAMIPYINKKMTVITNHISIAADLLGNEQAEVILLGGNLRKSSFSLLGFDMINQIKHYHTDKVFLSSKAIDIHYGVSDATALGGEAKKALIASGTEVYFLFDYSKLSTRAFYQVCEIDQVAHLIISQPAAKNPVYDTFISACRKRGIDLHIVSCPADT